MVRRTGHPRRVLRAILPDARRPVLPTARRAVPPTVGGGVAVAAGGIVRADPAARFGLVPGGGPAFPGGGPGGPPRGDGGRGGHATRIG
ncbi:hypothetical protein [Micromonospora humida]|uniref:Uncharacterized protein n=1 Tax=Micromonospora humida TaxID=2809018 RepID=A0ABS2J2R1_9ACTN|nr:hypothetical protein [Micromonospora humida]MBM7080852.1 hypothetical protein [Micromonospora humida]